MVKLTKLLKIVGIFHYCWVLLPRQTLLTNYKSFIRPHLDCEDVIYNQRLNESLSNRIESAYSKVVLPISRAIKGSSWEIYQELSLE